MCNLYNVTTTHEAMRRLFPKFGDVTNRVDPQLDVYPDYPAPVLRNIHRDDPELALLRWGMPTPPMDADATYVRERRSGQRSNEYPQSHIASLEALARR